MLLKTLHLNNFKGFKACDLEFDGKSAVLFGINGSGKSTVLAAINYLCWNWLNRLNPAQGAAFKSLNGSLVHSEADKLSISADFEMEDQDFTLKKEYTKARPGKGPAVNPNKKMYDDFISKFLEACEAESSSIPIFVNYGTNRSVLDIPLRIRNKHEFSKWTALERAIENELDYRTFFEWFRNQEDYEAEVIREKQDLSYHDPSLDCVRQAVQAMIPEFDNLKVKRNPLRLSVTKNGREFSVDQLSDGEKCTLALVGDLARRLALANQKDPNPLNGKGIVLIDEIELHMHPSWQRKVLPVLRQTFPNIQFIITTHSPQVLGEVNEDLKLFLLSEDEEQNRTFRLLERMDGFDSNYILENYMETDAFNPEFQTLLSETTRAIDGCDFEQAEKLISQIRSIVGLNHYVLIGMEGKLKRARLRHETYH